MIKVSLRLVVTLLFFLQPIGFMYLQRPGYGLRVPSAPCGGAGRFWTTLGLRWKLPNALCAIGWSKVCSAISARLRQETSLPSCTRPHGPYLRDTPASTPHAHLETPALACRISSLPFPLVQFVLKSILTLSPDPRRVLRDLFPYYVKQVVCILSDATNYTHSLISLTPLR